MRNQPVIHKIVLRVDVWETFRAVLCASLMSASNWEPNYGRQLRKVGIVSGV